MCLRLPKSKIFFYFELMRFIVMFFFVSFTHQIKNNAETERFLKIRLI